MRAWEPRWNVQDGFDERSPVIVPRDDFTRLRSEWVELRTALEVALSVIEEPLDDSRWPSQPFEQMLHAEHIIRSALSGSDAKDTA